MALVGCGRICEVAHFPGILQHAAELVEVLTARGLLYKINKLEEEISPAGRTQDVRSQDPYV